ncbi:Ldh family oxidoreductase [Pseudomonas sp. SWRI102]|uniref:Ldh family oxidoreductase n=1 Tax=Pseudomonas marvdashtae TaxID=2745500 RepID=A0A923JNX5_9PSED|nr:Ldh family oxidoreductase [Pseudomonas marvdashtae]MBV4551247.1 Ldh family oxidoreductase [Pseudomonas marvdashtae]
MYRSISQAIPLKTTIYRRLTLNEAIDWVAHLCEAKGCSSAVALSLAHATVAAQARGNHAVGFRHLADYLPGFSSGRINPRAEPRVSRAGAIIFKSDAQGGIAQLGVDRCFDSLCHAAQANGMAALSQWNSFTSGELGDYTLRFAQAGLIALAVANGPALVAVPGAKGKTYSTNPLSFAAPSADGIPLQFDQACSAAAFVNIAHAASTGSDIPEGWAVDQQGHGTRNALAALGGALLPFGGHRGANLMLMVEVLAAGLTGANWSLDAPDFNQGNQTPGCGLLLLLLAPDFFSPGFEQRLASQLARLTQMHVHRPGWERQHATVAAQDDGISVPVDLLEQLSRL